MVVKPGVTLAIAKRRQKVAELYLQSWTQTAIAGEVGVTQPTVSEDLMHIRREWRDSRIRDFDDAVELELRRIDRLERESWRAWFRSTEPHEVTKVTQTGSAKKAHKTVTQRTGDPRYLEQVHKCIASRRAILGLDAPTRIAPTSPDGDESYHSHVMMELMRLAEKSKDGPLVIDEAYVVRQIEETKGGDEGSQEADAP